MRELVACSCIWLAGHPVCNRAFSRWHHKEERGNTRCLGGHCSPVLSLLGWNSEGRVARVYPAGASNRRRRCRPQSAHRDRVVALNACRGCRRLGGKSRYAAVRLRNFLTSNNPAGLYREVHRVSILGRQQKSVSSAAQRLQLRVKQPLRLLE